jgi:hypothetical protein
MKVKSYYWDYINSEDYLENPMTESELKYHYSNIAFAQPLYRELEDSLLNKKGSLIFGADQQKPSYKTSRL